MKQFQLICLALIAAFGTAGAADLGALARSRGMHLGAAVTFPSAANLAAYDTVLAHEFNTVVCENAMKWTNTENTRNVFTYTSGDAIANFAIDRGMYVRGHNFVWHSQVPGWVSNITNRDTLLAVMKNHINQLAGHYKGKIYEWDVVNEAIAENGVGLRASFWYNRIGADFLDSAFVYARRADPNALLVYNDYSAEGMTGSTATKSTSVYNLVKGLKDRNIPIDGVGLQSHFNLTIDTASIGANMSRIEALGLNISITELDVATSNTTTNLATQKETYKSLMALCLRHPRCKTFVAWGVNDAQSWRGANAVALLFTGTTTLTPKPAYDGIVEALSGVTPVWQFQAARPGVLRQTGIKNGSILFGAKGSAFNLQGRQMAALPLPK